MVSYYGGQELNVDLSAVLMNGTAIIVLGFISFGALHTKVRS